MRGLMYMSDGVQWQVSPDMEGQKNAPEVIKKLSQFFGGSGDKQLFMPSADRKGAKIVSLLLPQDQHICFAPRSRKQWGRIECYEEESGCGGEDNRLQHRGTIHYRRAA